MNLRAGKNLLLFAALATASVVSAQRPESRPVALRQDILTIKQKADAGDEKSQIVLGDKLAANLQPADALVWYRRAATTGSTEAYYRVGTLLLHGNTRAAPGQLVLPNPAEGVSSVFRAATNLHPQACREMSRALQHGLGVETNWTEAFAWLQLFADREPASGGRELEALALKMTTRDLEAGRKLAKQFKVRRWPKLSVIELPKVCVPLRLDGVTAGVKTPLATINRRTLAEGETVSIPVPGRSVDVTCLEIHADSALVAVEGEADLRWLRLKP